MSAILFVRAESRSCQSFSITRFCTQLHVFALNYTFLHSITLFCTDLELIDMFLTNQNAEIVACILLGVVSIQAGAGMLVDGIREVTDKYYKEKWADKATLRYTNSDR